MYVAIFSLSSAVRNLLYTILFFVSFSLGAEISCGKVDDPRCSIQPCPPWVQKVSWSFPDNFEEHPDSYLLMDKQVEIDRKEEYYHAVRHLCSSDSVQAHSIIELDFDPSYESIAVHNLGVFRNNTYIDKIDTARMEVIQREKNIADSLYDGKKSWIIFLEDVQPGDVIEYSFSTLGKRPVLENYIIATFSLQQEAYLSQGYFRLVGSNASKFHFKGHLTSLQPERRDLPDEKGEWVWKVSSLHPYESVPFLPSWCIPVPMIQISGFDNWVEVAKWGSNLFQLPKDYSEELRQLARSFQAKSLCLEEQILRAIRFVQDDIRYLGFELGDNSYKPYDPNIVLKRRSGDCKDKVLLLMAILDLMGVRSHPVLVNCSLQEHLSEWLPSATLFDHAILQIEFENELFWVDPTQTCSGGSLRSMICGPFGKGLVLSRNATNLKEIPFNPKDSLRKTITTIDLSQPDASKIISKASFSGLWADCFRRRYRNGNGSKKIEKDFKDYFSRLYGVVTSTTPFEIKDNLEKNKISFSCAYDIDNPWKIDDVQGTRYIDLQANEVSSVLSQPVDAMRTIPCELEYPGYVLEDFFVTLPKGVNPIEPYRFEIDNDELRFLTEWKTKDTHCLHCRYELMTKKDHIPAEKIEKWHQDSRKISHLISRSLYIPEPKKETEGAAAQLTAMLVIIGIIVWLLYMLTRK